MPVDYYETLGVDRAANDEQIRRAFRRKAMEFHPDRNKTPGAEDKFKEINEAYQVLSDQEKRSRYDRFGHAGVNGGADRPFDGFDPFGGFGDIFDTFFGGGTRTANQPRAGEDIAHRVNLSFEEAVFGCERDIEIQRVEPCHLCSGAGNEPGTPISTCTTCNGAGQVRRAQRSVFGQFAVTSPCPACNGSGRYIETHCHNCRGRGYERRQRSRTVTIPAGVNEGMQVRITGEGDAGAHGGPPGNLYVQVRVQEHPLFARDEDDLVLRMGINIAEAALGSKKQVPTLDGDDVDLEIPAGTQSGRVFRVRGYGVPRLRRDGRATNRRGDIRVMVEVNVPQRINKYQRKLLEDLAYSLENHGNAPPEPAKPKAKGRRKSPLSGKKEPAETEPTNEPSDTAEAAEPSSEDKQKGLFDRIRDTFAPSDG